MQLVDFLAVHSEDRERFAGLLSFVLDYFPPQDSIVGDPSIPAQLATLRAFFLGGPSRGWLVLLLSPLLYTDEMMERIALLSTARLRTGAVHVSFMYGTLQYDLYQNGTLIHSYCSSESNPRFRENIPVPKQTAQLLTVFQCTDTSAKLLESVLSGPTEGWGEEILRRFLECLGLDTFASLDFEKCWENSEQNPQQRFVQTKDTNWVYTELAPISEDTPVEKEWLH